MKQMHKWLLTLLITTSWFLAEAQTNYEVSSDVSFRKGPGKNYKSIGTIKSGEKVYVFDSTNTKWFKIEYSGKLGYVSAQNLYRITEPVTVEVIATPAETHKTKNSRNWVFWTIGVLLLFLYFRSKGKKKETISSTQNTSSAPQTKLKQLNIPPSSYELHKEKKSDSSAVNYKNSDPKVDSSIIDVTVLNYDTEIKVPPNPSSYSTYQPPVYEDPYWKLGTKYKEKLQLTKDEVEIVNSQWASTNNFCSIDACCQEVIKLFLLSLRTLDKTYRKENSSLEEQLSITVDTILRKHFRYRFNSFNYTSGKDTARNEIYTVLFKHCENAVRNEYGHKRKLGTDAYFSTTAAVQQEFDTRIITPLKEILPSITATIASPDSETERELNAQNTSRWKDKFESISEKHKQNPSGFLKQILDLGELNNKNPSIENLFFEASKLIAKSDREISLVLYTHYIFQDLKSANFDNKQLNKTIQKSIFKTDDQLKIFEDIVANLIKDKNLKKAVEAIPGVFAAKRKKIKLDSESIKEVQLQHSETVELLNEYLQDETEESNTNIKAQETDNEELALHIQTQTETIQKSNYTASIPYTQTQQEVLDIFAKSNLSVIKKELESILKPKGLFINQVIESINEISFDVFDDVLIEEDDDYLTIYSEYFKRISVA